MDEKEFYNSCSYLLGVPHDYRDPLPIPRSPGRDGMMRNTYKSRYNGRTPGNGRFEGCGVIRVFGSSIVVNLRNPLFRGVYSSFDAALQAIGQAVGGPVRLLTESEIEQVKEQHRVAMAAIAEASKGRWSVDPRIAAARRMTADERIEMEIATREAHDAFDRVLRERIVEYDLVVLTNTVETFDTVIPRGTVGCVVYTNGECFGVEFVEPQCVMFLSIDDIKPMPKRRAPIFEVQELRESGYLHLFLASRPAGVRMSIGCVKLIEPVVMSPLALQALNRPSNYHELGVVKQWEIDRDLGILDWDGT